MNAPTCPPEYRPFDAACRRAVVYLRTVAACGSPDCGNCTTYRARARHVLDLAAAQVSRDVGDASCDLVRVGGGL